MMLSFFFRDRTNMLDSFQRHVRTPISAREFILSRGRATSPLAGGQYNGGVAARGTDRPFNSLYVVPGASQGNTGVRNRLFFRGVLAFGTEFS